MRPRLGPAQRAAEVRELAVHPIQMRAEPVHQEAAQLAAQSAVARFELVDVPAQHREQVAVNQLMGIELGMAEVAHVGLLILEMARREALQLAQQARQLLLRGAMESRSASLCIKAANTSC